MLWEKLASKRNDSPRISLMKKSIKTNYTHINWQVYWRRGSVLNWLKLSWFGTSLDWFTRPTELKSRNAYLLYSTLQEMLHASELQVNFRS